jgi:ribosomal protein S18 acetylase RimI-like enzyme
MTIRPAVRADAAALVRLINAAFAVERFFVDADRVDFAEVLRHLDTGTFLVEDGVSACVYVERRGDHAYLGLLSVDPPLQGSGLGRGMVAAAESYARGLGCRYMDLRVVSLREELPGFYRKLGYNETGIGEFPAEVPTKQPCYLIEMSKPL